MLQVYQERTEVTVVGERANLSVGRLRLYVQAHLPDWKDTAAAEFVWEPSHYESRYAISAQALRGVLDTLGVDLATLLDGASEWWRLRDEQRGSDDE